MSRNADDADRPNGDLPPQAPAYDFRTGEPLSDRGRNEPRSLEDELGMWAPDYPLPEPSQWGIPLPQIREDIPHGQSTRQIPPDPGRRPRAPMWIVGAVVVLLASGATLALLLVGSHKPDNTAKKTVHTSPSSPGSSALPPVISASPGQPTVTPSAPTTPTAPTNPTRHAKVLAPTASQTTTFGVAGPSIERNSAGQLTKYPSMTLQVQVGSYVDVICTLYGQSTTLGSLGTGNVWDYTAQGWFTDQALLTNSPDPVANACVGNISDPTEGSEPPSPTMGPFPIYSGGATVEVRSDHSSQASPVGVVNDGDLVTLVCQVTAEDVTSPNDLTGKSIGHSAQWDQLTSGGWVPDALVNSASDDSVAPPC